MAEDAALIPTSIVVIHRPSPRSPPKIFRISSLIVIRLPPTQHQLASPAASEVRAHGFPTGTSLDDHGGLELEPDHDRNAAGRTSEGAVQVCRVQTSSSGGFGLEHQSGRMANGHLPSIGHHLRVSVSQPWSYGRLSEAVQCRFSGRYGRSVLAYQCKLDDWMDPIQDCFPHE